MATAIPCPNPRGSSNPADFETRRGGRVEANRGQSKMNPINAIAIEDQKEETVTHRRKFVFLGALGVVASVLLSASAVAEEPAAPPYAACLTCHGDAGNNPIPGMMAPKLAGLDAAYTTKQLHDFQSGRRVFDAMNTLAKGLSASDIKAAADYFSAQTRTGEEVYDKSLAKQGQAIVQHGIAGQAVPACANCHNDGVTGTFRYPRLAGQKADYVFNQLSHFKSGERHNDFGQMSRVAMRLTEGQMKAVAEYVSRLGYPLVPRGPGAMD
jgi:cytochrome c553